MRDERCIPNTPEHSGRHYGCSCDDEGLVRVRDHQILVNRDDLRDLLLGINDLRAGALPAMQRLGAALYPGPVDGGDANEVAPHQPERTSVAQPAAVAAGGLLPCPWCGGPAERAGATVGCWNPGCPVSPFVRGHKDTAAAWNRRAPLATFEQALTAMEGHAVDLSPRDPGDETSAGGVRVAAILKEYHSRATKIGSASALRELATALRRAEEAYDDARGLVHCPECEALPCICGSDELARHRADEADSVDDPLHGPLGEGRN